MLTVPALVAQATANPKREQARKLVSLLGVGDIAATEAKSTLEQQKQSGAKVPDGFWEAFAQELSGERMAEEIFVPLFEKTYSEAELRAAIAYHSSPEGRSFSAKQATLSAEARKAGERWGMELALKVMQRLMEKDRDAPQ
jgi:hypothetical protein